jgi:ABC-type Fe3+ transport system permease subunit/DNA-binding beta-propeller fold protein YncE
MSWPLIQNSLFVAICATILAGVVGGIFALFAAGLPRSTRNLAVALGISVLVLPPFLISNTWLNYFGLNGTWRPYLDFDIYSLKGTVLLIALELWPITFLLSLGAILRIDRTYLEQEALFRGGALMRHLVWPSCRSALAFSLPVTFVLALNNFAVPALLQTKVFAAEVWLSFNTKFDYAEALRLSWPLIATPLAFLLLVRFEPIRWVARSAEFPDRFWRARSGMIFAASCAFGALTIVLSLALPLAQLVTSSRTWTELLPSMAAGKSAVWNSLLFAFLSALLVSVFGALVRKTRSGVLGWLFFLTPGVLVGIACICLFNRPGLAGFYQSIGIVLAAFAARYFSLGWSAARVAFGLTDRVLSDVVTSLGASRWQRFRLAEWPQARGILLGGFYLVYLLCLWEVETLILIVPPGRETLAVRIFNMLHYGHAGQVDALCLWMLALGLAPLIGFVIWQGLIRLADRNVRVPAALFLLPLFLFGCAPREQNSTKLDSKIFGSVQVFGSRGTGAGQFNKPRSIAVDREDNFYVVDMTGRVQKFSPDGKFLLSWQMPQTEKGKPKGVACDHAGNIIVVEPHYSRVNHFTSQGKLVAQWGENGTNKGQLFFPRSVGVNSKGDIYLSEYGMVERIQHFSNLGTNFIGSIGRPGTEPGELNRGEGIGIAPDDTLFEADSCNHRVQIFSPEGKWISSFGSAGSGPNQMSYPYDVQIDPLGYRYVCEFGNSRVQVFDAQNQSFEILGGAGAEAGQMNNPWSITLDSRGNLYVADSLNHRVQKFLRRNPLIRSTHTHALREGRNLAAK